MTEPRRKVLGRQLGLANREVVYEMADGIEVEATESYEVVHRRVFFDDVLLVTYHRAFGALFLTVNLLWIFLMVSLSAIIAAVAKSGEVWPAIVVWMIMATPSILLVLIRLLLRVEVINVFGRRSKATLRYWFRKQKARETYGRICARVRQVQRAAEPTIAPAAESPGPLPPPAPPLP